MVTKMKNRKQILTLFYEPLTPLYMVCRSVGIFPLKARKDEGDIFLEAKKSDRVYLSSYYFVYLLLSTYALYCISTDEVNYNVVSKELVLTECVLILTLMFMTIFCCYFFRPVLVNCVKLLAEVDETLPRLNIEINYVKAKKNNIRVLAVMFCSILIRSSVMSASIRIDFIQQFTLFMATLIKSLSKYEFIAILLPMSERFQKLNNALVSYKKRKTDLSDDLYTLHRLHFKLCNISRMINAGFAFQLLASLAVSLINILFQSFYLYVILTKKYGISTGWMIASPIVWLIDELLEIYFLVNECANTAETANSTSILLHELRNSVRRNAVDTHIQMYSLQMLHQKLEFSALNFFNIDYSLLYSILGAVTTYLVIFIQFDQSQDSKTTSNFILNNTCTK